jgi:hypothetical protein
MQRKARLTKLSLIQTGTMKNGELKNQDLIIETDGQFQKKACISFCGDKVNCKSVIV